MPWYSEKTSIPFLSSAIRSVITAGEDKQLVVSDLASIEGRSLAYLAGEQWKLDAYQDYDLGIGSDLYVMAYAMSFGVKLEEVGDKERQLGKVIELALGYGGGVGAFITFSLVYGIDLEKLADEMFDQLPKWAKIGALEWWEISEEKGKTYGLSKKAFITCDSIKRMWRKANENIVQFWYDLEDAAKTVLINKRKTFVKAGKITIDKKGTWMRGRLPSGRYLSYPGARLVSNRIRYLGLNTYTRKWCNLSTYGGKLSENFTQGFAADVFYYGLLLADKAGYKTILPVHDEGVTECNFDLDVEGLNKCLSTVPPWAKGLPLAAKGFSGYRFRKD